MQTTKLIINQDFTIEERYAVIASLTKNIFTRKKVNEAFHRLFGTQLPHVQMERLIRMNSRALTKEYNKRLFSILGENSQASFYKDKTYIETHQLLHAPDWDDGKLIARWEKFTKKPNPHHILPESRGGTNNVSNFWNIDRLTHNDFHTVFQNLTPSEQVILLMIVHKRLLSRDFTHEFRKVLQAPLSESSCYQKGVMRKNYHEEGW